MLYTECPFFGLQSKKVLKRLLRIQDSRFLKQDYCASLIYPHIATDPKKRLIESPHDKLKILQSRIKTHLGKIDVNDNVFSGIKGRSYADNAKQHVGDARRNLFKIDLTAFFPSISRETVFRFFVDDLRCSSDVAEILTNLTTIDLDKATVKDMDSVNRFLRDKKVTCRNHLISGSPSSQIMCYLVNHQMFDEMQAAADAYGATMTIYVDDVAFSSENRISYLFRSKIFAIIRKYGYQISAKKVKLYTKTHPKLVTGVIIDSDGQPAVKNSLRLKIIKKYEYLRDHPEDELGMKQLRGLLSAARQAHPNAFSGIYAFAYQTHKKTQSEQ